MPAIDLTLPTESYAGLDASFGLDEFIVTAQIKDINHDIKASTFDGSGLGTGTKNKRVGMREGDFKGTGFMAGRPGKFTNVLNQRFGRNTPVNLWYTTEPGFATGTPIVIQPSRISGMAPKIGPEDVITVDVEAVAAGAMYMGHTLLSPETLLSGTTGTTAIHDNTAGGGASTYGGAALVCLYALDGGTTPTFQIVFEHSTAVGGTYTTFATLTAPVSTPGSWLIPIPSTTTINAFTRATWTVTGTPTTKQAMAAFARSYSRAA